jgi:hypothetical protein
MTMETYLRLGHLVCPGVRGHPISMVDTHLRRTAAVRFLEPPVLTPLNDLGRSCSLVFPTGGGG